MIPCLVVTLKRSVERQRTLEAEMARVGLSFIYIDGVDGATLEDPLIYREIHREFPEYLPHCFEDITLRPGEIGCYLSFIRAFRYCTSRDFEHVLICEDDVRFSFDDPAILQHLVQINLSWDQIKLAHTDHPLVRGIWIGRRRPMNQKFNFYFYWRGIIGTTCNLYTYAGMCKLLKNLPRFELKEPIDASMANKRYLMDFVSIFVRPGLATESMTTESTIVPERSNKDAFTQYLKGQGFFRRKWRQIQRIGRDLRYPVRALVNWIKKSPFLWYCFKYLILQRKRPNPLRNHTLLGSSVVSANVRLFRKFGVKIPWLDPLWVLPDIVVGTIYWIFKPSQYRVAGWWMGVLKRRFGYRSFALKPGELTALRIFYLVRQAGYYGRWLRHLLINPPTGVVMWNGWRTTWAQKAIKSADIKAWYFENAPFPECVTMDPNGVNANSYMPQNPDFYLAWAKLNPDPKISWTSIPDIIAQRPISPKTISSELALIKELPEKFIFVPLQKQDDSQIYLHAGWVETVDNFVRTIYSCCSALPDNWAVIIKTHPSDHSIEPEMIFQDHPNNVYNGANFDSMELLKECSGVVNINGSMGLQAYLFEKPSVVLGNSFYAFGDMATCCDSAEHLREIFSGFPDLRFNAHLRSCFLDWLLNHYYLRVPKELPQQIITSRLRHCQVDEHMLEQVSDRLNGRWDPWAGLSDDPNRWASLARKPVLTQNVELTRENELPTSADDKPEADNNQTTQEPAGARRVKPAGTRRVKQDVKAHSPPKTRSAKQPKKASTKAQSTEKSNQKKPGVRKRQKKEPGNTPKT